MSTSSLSQAGLVQTFNGLINNALGLPYTNLFRFGPEERAFHQATVATQAAAVQAMTEEAVAGYHASREDEGYDTPQEDAE